MSFVEQDNAVTRRRVLLALAAVGLGAHGGILRAQSAAPKASAAQLLDALRAGGLVVFFRHPPTTWNGVDRIDWPRERQRLLSEAGIEQSRTVGRAFKRHQLQAGEVLASPFARCRDMAEIAFGRVEERLELLGLLSQDSGRQERTEYALSLLRRPVEGKQLRIIVAHGSNIIDTTGITPAEGSAVIVRPGGGSSGFEVLGMLTADDWRSLANY